MCKADDLRSKLPRLTDEMCARLELAIACVQGARREAAARSDEFSQGYVKAMGDALIALRPLTDTRDSLASLVNGAAEEFGIAAEERAKLLAPGLPID